MSNRINLDDIPRLLSERMEPWDARPCRDATVHDLDLLAIRDAMARMGTFDSTVGVEPYLVDRAQIAPFVHSLCVADPLTGVLRPRNFAILLFGREPQRFVPGAYSVYSTYPGTDRSDAVARRYELAGTLLDQAKRVLGRLDAEAITLFDKTDLKHPNAQQYPRWALHAAMVNALAHRDYELADPTSFTAFAGRIEFLSPGSLPHGVTLADLRARTVTQRWRNPGLVWVLNRLLLAPGHGHGIAMIRHSMKAEGCPPPRFNASEMFVLCVLRAHPRSVATAAAFAQKQAKHG